MGGLVKMKEKTVKIFRKVFAVMCSASFLLGAYFTYEFKWINDIGSFRIFPSIIIFGWITTLSYLGFKTYLYISNIPIDVFEVKLVKFLSIFIVMPPLPPKGQIFSKKDPYGEENWNI